MENFNEIVQKKKNEKLDLNLFELLVSFAAIILVL